MRHYRGSRFLDSDDRSRIKGVLIKLEDLRNRSMRSTLTFENIKEENESTWKDSAGALGKFIGAELDMNYADE